MDLYAENKNKLKTGDCLLWQTQSVVGSLIRAFTGHEFNHAGLVIRPDKHGLFRDRRFTIEAVGNGVILRLLSECLRGFHGRVWLYPLMDGFDGARQKIAEWAIEQEGIPYDYGSLFKQIFGRVSADMKYYFCSEFCYFGWKENGIPVNEDKAPRPGDIPHLGIFKAPIMIFDSIPKPDKEEWHDENDFGKEVL